MKFLDEAKVYVKSGDGGNGCVSFLRLKFIEFGGPNGGDGGKGGDVWAEGVDGLNTLIDYRYRVHFKAKNGGRGMGQNMAGAKGEDALLKVPAGTEILDEDGETLITDIAEVGQRVLLAKGGNGGFGNAHFKTSTNRAPRHANPGQEGKARWIRLRLALREWREVALQADARSVLYRDRTANYPVPAALDGWFTDFVDALMLAKPRQVIAPAAAGAKPLSTVGGDAVISLSH